MKINHPNRNRAHKFQQFRRRTVEMGFSLIEIMVAIAIISVGLLGMAALQATAMKNSYASYQRSLANLQAQDATERIWVHRCTLKAGSGLSTLLAEWQATHASASNTVAMPDWSGSIAAVSGSPGSYTITIAWRERSTVQGQEGSTLTYAQTVSVPFVGC